MNLRSDRTAAIAVFDSRQTWGGSDRGIQLFGIATRPSFAALDQLKIAPAIVNGLYYAILAIIVGSAIVAVGGGGIQTMRGYWERTSHSLESKTREIKTVTVPDAETRPMARTGGEGEDAIPPAPGPRTS
jgi:hypothetical protein